ncbi:MAG: hypothetical protein IPK10_04050 [Bacteroidetes bacterium]|nr:hypothetical protein [Bacteroidota bacterium]
MLFDTSLFACTQNGGLNVSHDGGLSWTTANNGINQPSISTIAFEGNNLYATAFGGYFYWSTDGGNSWTLMNSTLPLNGNPFLIELVGNSIFVGTGVGGIVMSNDHGSTWIDVNTGLPGLNIQALASSNQYLFAGTTAGGVWKRPLSQLVRLNEFKEDVNFEVYPNPAKI